MTFTLRHIEVKTYVFDVVLDIVRNDTYILFGVTDTEIRVLISFLFESMKCLIVKINIDFNCDSVSMVSILFKTILLFRHIIQYLN